MNKRKDNPLKYVVNILVSCKGCSRYGHGIHGCLDGADLMVINHHVLYSSIPNRDKCIRMKEAWKEFKKLRNKYE